MLEPITPMPESHLPSVWGFDMCDDSVAIHTRLVSSSFRHPWLQDTVPTQAQQLHFLYILITSTSRHDLTPVLTAACGLPRDDLWHGWHRIISMAITHVHCILRRAFPGDCTADESSTTTR